MNFIEQTTAFRNRYLQWQDRHDIVRPPAWIDSLTIQDWVKSIDFRFGLLTPDVSLGDGFFRLIYEVDLATEWHCVKVSNKKYSFLEVVELLVAKNKDYGNSALQVPSLLPTLKPSEAILVRLSDKRSRLNNLAAGAPDTVGESIEDTLKDILGYLILFWIAVEQEQE